MALFGIPVFVHEIGTQHNDLMPEEKCPVFNPHDRSDLNSNGEVLIPHDELFMRQVLASYLKIYVLCKTIFTGNKCSIHINTFLCCLPGFPMSMPSLK